MSDAPTSDAPTSDAPTRDSATADPGAVSWTLKDRVYELRLGADPINEIGSVMLERLETFLEALDPDAADVLIIHSASPRGFCAGADLRELYFGLLERPEAQHEAAIREFLDRIHLVMDRLDMLPLTTIGVIHKVCFGGGFELALTCDVLIAEKNARFAFPELRLGIIPGFGGIPRLKREVGNAAVRDLLLTGRSIRARRAFELGLVSQVVASGEGLGVARLMAGQMTRYDGDARRTCKAFIKPLPVEALRAEKEHFIRLIRRPQVREALRKFVESKDVRPYLA